MIPDGNIWGGAFLVIKVYGGDEMMDAAARAFAHQVCIASLRTAQRC